MLVGTMWIYQITCILPILIRITTAEQPRSLDTMNSSVSLIPLGNLAMGLIPALTVVSILYIWQYDYKRALYAFARMLLQLMLVGVFLSHIFGVDSAGIALAVLGIMLLAASWISMRSANQDIREWYLRALTAIALGGGATLVIVTRLVLELQPWYQTSIMIPLAGMIFFNAMNSVSLTAERLRSELKQGKQYSQARSAALQAALIPITNSLLAVGLVSLPGMMTGQILSGVAPLLAVRYQIMVMCMAYGSAGISAALYLMLADPKQRMQELMRWRT